MPVFGPSSVQMSSPAETLKVHIRPVSIEDSTCVQLGADSGFDLEGRCSIQLSYGRNLLYINVLRLIYMRG